MFCMEIYIILGGLFDISESKQEVAFRYAVERINSNRKILPKSLVSAQIEKIPPQDSFHASKRGKSSLNQSLTEILKTDFAFLPYNVRIFYKNRYKAFLSEFT